MQVLNSTSVSLKLEFLNITHDKIKCINETAITTQQPKYSDILKNNHHSSKKSRAKYLQTYVDINTKMKPLEVNIKLIKVKIIRNGDILIGYIENLSDLYEIKQMHGLNLRICVINTTTLTYFV